MGGERSNQPLGVIRSHGVALVSAAAAPISAQASANWRQAGDLWLHRRKMSKAIATLLSERTRRQESEQLTKAANRYETMLLENAENLGAYLDRTTLRLRLRKAVEASERTLQQNGDNIKQERKRMTLVVLKFLEGRQSKNPAAAAESQKDAKQWRSKLLLMSRHCEVSLFRQAATLEEYKDASTLKQRLRVLLDKTLSTRGES